MTRIHWLRMTRKNWLEWRTETQTKSMRYLENRIVYCSDCDACRSLTFHSGSPACSSCGSENWTYIGSSVTFQFRHYDDPEAKAKTLVDRTVGNLQTEVFFAPGVRSCSLPLPESHQPDTRHLCGVRYGTRR
jgi:hypothetical protein